MCKAFEDMKEEGRLEGRLEGRAQGIIESGVEFGLSENRILCMLHSKLNIPEAECRQYFMMFGKQADQLFRTDLNTAG